MIPLKLTQGQLFDKAGNPILPNENGIITVEIEGTPRRFVYEKLVSFLERNGQVSEKPILRPLNRRKRAKKGFAKVREKKGNVGHHRRKRIVVDNGVTKQEFESITKASNDLKICRSKIFSVLNGKLANLKGYKIKYAS